jgi:hypothetical protein
LSRLWAQPRQALRCHREVQQLQQQGHVVLRRHATGVQSLLHGGRVRRRLVSLHQPAYLPQEVGYRQVGSGLAIRQTLSRIHAHLVPRQLAAELRHEPGLAYARRTDHSHHLTLTHHRLRQVLLKQRQLPLSTHKGTLSPGAPSGDAGMPLEEALYSINGLGRGVLIGIRAPVGCGLYLRMNQLIGRCAQQNRPRLSLLLESRGHVEGGSDHRR